MATNNSHSAGANDREKHLASLETQRSLITDRVRSVIQRNHYGLFLYGPPGTGKTHTVLQTVKESDDVSVHYYRGHLTPIGLFDLFMEHSEDTIILDDVPSLLDEQKALQLFLAALGTPDDDGSRTLRYKRSERSDVVRFRGGVIVISNLQLRSGNDRRRPLLDAIANRTHTINFAPSQEEIAALMMDIAAKGWDGQRGRHLDPDRCAEIAEFVIAESRFSELPLDLRTLVDKAFPDVWFWLQGETDNHWHELVNSSLHERPITASGLTQADALESERQLVVAILEQHGTTTEQLHAWRQGTISPRYPGGKSERAFYRRKREI